MTDINLLNRKKAAALVQEMDVLQLMEYIEKRLKRISTLPPLVTQSEEAPAYFLEKLYEQSENQDFKSRFRNAIARLLAAEQIDFSDADYLAALFIFSERYIIFEAVAPVGGMVLSEKLKGLQSSDGDLHRRALMALARMPQGLKMTDIWLNAVEDFRYTAAAFAALRSQGLDTILKFLPRFIRQYNEFPESVDVKFAVKTLYEEFNECTEDEISELIERSIENENLLVKQSIYSILMSSEKRFSLVFKTEGTDDGSSELIAWIRADLFKFSMRKEKDLEKCELCVEHVEKII